MYCLSSENQRAGLDHTNGPSILGLKFIGFSEKKFRGKAGVNEFH
jgi:hypothetical protein